MHLRTFLWNNPSKERQRETGKLSTLTLSRYVFTKQKKRHPRQSSWDVIPATLCRCHNVSSNAYHSLNLIHNTWNEAWNYIQHVFSLLISSSRIVRSCFALPPFWSSAQGERCEQSTSHPTRTLKIRGYTTERFPPPRRVFDQRPLPPYPRNTMSASMSVVQWNAKWLAVNELSS